MSGLFISLQAHEATVVRTALREYMAALRKAADATDSLPSCSDIGAAQDVLIKLVCR